jgi:hypothetical protein
MGPMGRRITVVLAPLGAVLGLVACGGSPTSGTAPSTSAPATAAPSPATTAPAQTTPAATTPGGPAALQGEAASAATGDIPDNQIFLTFRNPAAGYSMRYPEGWAQQGSGPRVTFRDKNNIVRVVIGKGSAATEASARRDLSTQPGVTITSPPQRTTISGAPAIKVVYTAQSAPNPVTGKRVVLMVDRLYLAHSGRTAVVDLGTPQGVDNVDAYRLMINSFRWR